MIVIPPQALPGFGGGAFWDGRAEGCGKNGPLGTCAGVVDTDRTGGVVSDTITAAALPLSTPGSTYDQFLGPTADQALNPFPKGVEQNAGEKKTCQQVKTAKYKKLYDDAYGEPINCQDAALRKSFERIAIALAAWQRSHEVVPFASRRDKFLRGETLNPPFSALEQEGRALFYGPGACSACHNGRPDVLTIAFGPGSGAPDETTLDNV